MGWLADMIDADRETPGERHMRLYCEAIEAGEPVPDETRQFLHDAFTAIRQDIKERDGEVNRDTLKRALELTRPRGRGADTFKRLDTAIEVERLRGQGLGADKARAAVAVKTGQAFKTVRCHQMKYEKEARDLLAVDAGLERERAMVRWVIGELLGTLKAISENK